MLLGVKSNTDQIVCPAVQNVLVSRECISEVSSMILTDAAIESLVFAANTEYGLDGRLLSKVLVVAANV